MEKKYLFPILIIIFIIILYSNSLTNDFTFADNNSIVKNSNLKYFEKSSSSFFNKQYFEISKETSYRPVATLTHFINYSIWKLNPVGFHLFSLLLHIINVLLLYLLLIKLFNNKTLSFIISLIYLSHPILTEIGRAHV
jgi:protein O-mannosyl-transferase